MQIYFKVICVILQHNYRWQWPNLLCNYTRSLWKAVIFAKGKREGLNSPHCTTQYSFSNFRRPLSSFSHPFPLKKKKKQKSFSLIPASLCCSEVSSPQFFWALWMLYRSPFFHSLALVLPLSLSLFLPAWLSSMVRLKSSAVEGYCLAVCRLTHFTSEGSISLPALLWVQPTTTDWEQGC